VAPERAAAISRAARGETAGELSGGAGGTGGDLSGGAAGTGGDLSGGAAGTGGDLSGGAAGTGGDPSGGAAGTGGAGGVSTCRPRVQPRDRAAPIHRVWTASASPNSGQADLAIDGNEGTRYTTNALGTGDEWIQVDLCEARTVVGINVVTTSGTDVAKSYTVQVSTDGNTWETVLTSTTPAQQRMALTFDPVTAQYIRLNQTGRMTYWWSIHELSVECQ